MFDLTLPGSLKLLSETISKDIDTYCVTKYSEGSRSHLGASQIGKSCSRALWYNFRWVYFKVYTGQQYRLFQRGHFEEPRFTEYLEGIGCEVKCFDDNNLEEKDKGKRQIRIYGCKGHFAGSLDATVKLPERYQIQQEVVFLGEFKTQGTQKFAKLVEDGCQLNKYIHYCQMCVYGYKLGLKYGIYLVVDKNTDYLHIEVIELDWFLGKELEDKAERIIFSQVPPNKIAASADYYECKFCDYKEVCWFDKPAVKNCRSCKRAEPICDAQWLCNYYDNVIPKDFIKIACDEWLSII